MKKIHTAIWMILFNKMIADSFLQDAITQHFAQMMQMYFTS